MDCVTVRWWYFSTRCAKGGKEVVGQNVQVSAVGEVWGGNIRDTKEGKGEKQVRAVVAGRWEANRRLSRQ